MKLIKVMLSLLFLASASGCVLTKIVSVPMRVVGAVVSVIPVAGNVANNAIGKAANTIDKLPL